MYQKSHEKLKKSWTEITIFNEEKYEILEYIIFQIYKDYLLYKKTKFSWLRQYSCIFCKFRNF